MKNDLHMKELVERMDAEIAQGLIVIVHAAPDEATAAARAAAGYEMRSLCDGRMAWVHGSLSHETADVADMVRDLYDEDFQQRMREKFLRPWDDA